MRNWTSSQRRRRANTPPRRMDRRGPNRHARCVADRKEWNRLADLVLRERKAAGWTQKQLADRMDVDVRSVRRIEAGQSVAKTTVAAIDSAFSLPPGTARATLEPGQKEPLRGADALNRILTMTREEMLAEAEIFEQIEPGGGDAHLRKLLDIRARHWEQHEQGANTPHDT